MVQGQSGSSQGCGRCESRGCGVSCSFPRGAAARALPTQPDHGFSCGGGKGPASSSSVARSRSLAPHHPVSRADCPAAAPPGSFLRRRVPALPRPHPCSGPWCRAAPAGKLPMAGPALSPRAVRVSGVCRAPRPQVVRVVERAAGHLHVCPGPFRRPLL